MLKVPAVIIYMIIAFNITAFAVLLQLDMLIFKALVVKVIVWLLTLGAWYMAYLKRDVVWSMF